MPGPLRNIPGRRALRRLAAAAIIGTLVLPVFSCASMWSSLYRKLTGRRTVEEVLGDIGPAAEARLTGRFAAVSLPYPPPLVTLVAYKRERALELWAPGPAGNVRVYTYVITAVSGTVGPKLKEGDMQVPEGIYSIEELEPNSTYYLGLRLDYPNTMDLLRARKDGRANPGSDIYIHGRDYSEGCIAVGDRAIEELFALAARIGIWNISVIIGPRRFEGGLTLSPGLPEWAGALYAEISGAITGAGLVERGR